MKTDLAEVPHDYEISPGMYPGMPAATYHNHKGSYSKTSLSHFAKSGLEMMHHRENPQSKPQWDFGTALHTAVLQPERWEDDIVLQPAEIKVRRGKAWDAFAAENEGKTIITQEQYIHIETAHFNLAANKEAYELLTGGLQELSAFWQVEFEKDPDLGVFRSTIEGLPGTQPYHTLLLKCRPDSLPGDCRIVDLKSCNDITPEGFGRAAYNYKYHWSAYLSTWGMTELTNHEHTDYYFVCVENHPPFDVAIYKTPIEIMEMAYEEIRELLPLLATADKTDTWPGQPKTIQRLQFPGYAFTKHENRFHAGAG